MITLYVLKGKTGKRYVGITNNLSRHLKEHRARHSKAGEIIGNFKVLHTESFSDHRAARLREKFLKSGKGRKWLDMIPVFQPKRGQNGSDMVQGHPKTPLLRKVESGGLFSVHG